MKKKIIIIVIILLIIPVVIYFGFPGILYNMSVNSAREKAGLEKKIIQIEDHSIAYLEGGNGQSILMLHGLGGNKDNWSAFAKTITPKYHVVTLDLPGSGESSKVETGVYSIRAQVERVGKIAVALKLNKFHLIGTAMGGSIAGQYAVRNPDKLLSLAFFNTEGVSSPEKSEYTKMMANWKNPLSPNKIEEFDRMLEFMFIEPPSIPGPIKKYLLGKAINARAFNTKIFWEVFGEGYSLEPDLSKIKVKTLILWGDKDNKLHVSSAKVLAKGLEDPKTVIMKGAGHLLMRQKPGEAADHYLKFIGGI